MRGKLSIMTYDDMAVIPAMKISLRYLQDVSYRDVPVEIVPLHYVLSLQLSCQTWCCKPGADFLLIDSETNLRNEELGNEQGNGVYNSNNIVFQEDVIHCKLNS